MFDADITTRDALRHLSVDEPGDPATLDRRRFLQLVGMGVGAGLIAGGTGSLIGDVLVHDPSAWAAGPVGPSDGILVVIGMFGGNDGLNTVVPFNDGNYYAQHGGLALPGAHTLPLTGDVGLNPALSTLKDFWDRGQLAVVQGIGYPNPDLSHFNSMAYWMSGVTRGIPTSGWIGRWLDGYLSGGPDLYAAAEVGTSVPLHLVGTSRRGTVVPLGRPDFGAGTEPRDLRMFAALNSMRAGAATGWQAKVSQAFVDQLDIAKHLAPHYPDALPAGPLTARLEVAARLINANLGFRVLTAGWGDFDSHANQPRMHPSRMSELNEAVGRFFALLNPAWLSRVTVMTYSEFGRTSWASDDGGTDHGSSAPHFVFGQNVKGGLYGARPSLANLGRWERMPFSVDFRSYYASIIDGWLGGGSSTVLGGNYENLGLFRAGPGASADGGGVLPLASVSPPAGFVPMAPVRVMDSRDGTGGVRNDAMAAGETCKVPVRGVAGVPGDAVAVVANVTAVDASEPGYFTVFPGQTARPGTSNLNTRPGRPIPNLVVMGIGDDGCIDVFNAQGTAHCLVDVFGYFAAGGAGDRFTSLPPRRLFDTRTGAGVRPGKIAHLSPVDVQVSGVADVPADATAVVLNLTVVEPESPGWMRARPAGETVVTDTSNLNYFANDVVPNLTMCKLGANGQITVDAAGAGAHVLGDVFGYFGGGGGGLLRATPPERLLDTRIGNGAPQAPIGGAATARLVVGGRGSIPANATAVVLNVTATNVQGASYVTVWPDGQSMPDTSNLNVFGGQTIANLVVVRLGAGGALQFANPVSACDVIADALGYFVE